MIKTRTEVEAKNAAMPRKKADSSLVAAEVAEVAEPAPIRKVHVRENTVRTYDTLEPDAELEIDDDADGDDEQQEAYVDPIKTFLSGLAPEDTYLMRVYVLPNYYINGKLGGQRVGEDSLFVTQFSFGPEEIFEYENIIKGSHNWATTPGGKAMFDLQLVRRDPSRGYSFKKRWNQAIAAPLPGHVATQPQQQFPVIVNPPAQPPPDPVRPVETLKEQMGLFKGIVEFAKDLMPAPAPVQNGSGDGDTWQEKLLLAFAARADAPIDKIFDAMSNGSQKSPGLLDAVIEYAPHVGPTIGQGLNALMTAWARRIEIGNQETARQNAAAAMPAPQAPALPSAPAQVEAPVPTTTETATQEPEQPQTPPPPPTPRQIFEYAYRKAIQRAVEDCIEQVQLSKLDPLNAPTLSPKPAAEAIYALTERFDPENWKEENEFLMDLLNIESGKLFQAQPGEVLILCAAAAPNERTAGIIMGLTQEPAALKWVELLQGEIKAIIEEAKEGEGEHGNV